VRWRLIALVQWLHDAFAVLLEEATVSRERRPLVVERIRHVMPKLDGFDSSRFGMTRSRRASPCRIPADRP
jgi:hypothetical protein